MIDFYIVVHSPGIIEFFEKSEKYKSIQSYKYLLVGNHDADYTTEKIIQCNKLENNIEHCKNFLAYTGWYALANNIDINKTTKYICLLEYDTDVMENFNYEVFAKKIESDNLNCYGLSNMDLHDGIFVNTIFTHKTLSYLKSKNIKQIKPNNTKWLTTNNIIFKTEFFVEYFKDPFVLDFFNYLENDPMSGHFLERFISIFCFINNIQFDIVEDSGLVHRGLDSHCTQNIYNSQRGYEQFKTINKISD